MERFDKGRPLFFNLTGVPSMLVIPGRKGVVRRREEGEGREWST